MLSEALYNIFAIADDQGIQMIINEHQLWPWHIPSID